MHLVVVHEESVRLKSISKWLNLAACVVRAGRHTWCLHHGLHVLFLQLLNAFGLDHGLLLQRAHLVHVLVVEEFQV